MKKTIILMIFLITGLFLSQYIPILLGELSGTTKFARQYLTMSLLAFIMIEVGREFTIDLKNKKQYGVDYLVAATAATFPWIFVSLYFFLFLMPEISASGKPAWMEALLAGRFAAPTSAGVLFSMLTAAGLANTWAFNKTRILAIFDDLDTVLLMVPLQILMVGFVWQLGGILLIIFLILFFGIKYYRKVNVPMSWKWILLYAFIITGISEILYYFSTDPITHVGLHIEILLPAFIFGCMMKPHTSTETINLPIEEEKAEEHIAAFIISCVFLFLVGFSMPAMFSTDPQAISAMPLSMIVFHVLVVTVISNIGKMVVCVCYKKEASFKERLAVSISMFPRGEVGAGVLAVSLSYNMSGPFITVAFMSLALNLLLTGPFIFITKSLLTSNSRNNPTQMTSH